MGDHQTYSPSSPALSSARLCARLSVISSNHAFVSFHLRTFQPPMESHHIFSSHGGAAMRAYAQVCSIDVPSKRAPDNSSPRLSSTDSLWIIYAHTKVNDTTEKFSTLHTTVLFEGPSGFIIRLCGNGESYASSPSIGYDGDTIEETQVLWTTDVMGKSPQQHAI